MFVEIFRLANVKAQCFQVGIYAKLVITWNFKNKKSLKLNFTKKNININIIYIWNFKTYSLEVLKFIKPQTHLIINPEISSSSKLSSTFWKSSSNMPWASSQNKLCFKLSLSQIVKTLRSNMCRKAQKNITWDARSFLALKSIQANSWLWNLTIR